MPQEVGEQSRLKLLKYFRLEFNPPPREFRFEIFQLNRSFKKRSGVNFLDFRFLWGRREGGGGLSPTFNGVLCEDGVVGGNSEGVVVHAAGNRQESLSGIRLGVLIK